MYINISKNIPKLNVEGNLYGKFLLFICYLRDSHVNLGSIMKLDIWIFLRKWSVPDLKSLDFFPLHIWTAPPVFGLVPSYIPMILAPPLISGKMPSLWNLTANQSWWYCINGSIIKWKKDGLHFDESCKAAIVLVWYYKIQMYYLCNLSFQRKTERADFILEHSFKAIVSWMWTFLHFISSECRQHFSEII